MEQVHVRKSAIDVTGWLQAGFLAVFLLLGWAPLDRKTWLMENSIVVVGAAAIWFTRHQFYWTTRSWALVLLFLCLHQIGTHFTYPRVPYNSAFHAVSGLQLDVIFGWPRNQYDRFVHLCYGLLLALPLRDIVVIKCRLQGAWASLIAWSFILATSMLYELMEWIGGYYLGGGDSAFVGAQGDFWDAQKDMALAAVGALLVLTGRGQTIRGLRVRSG